MKVLVCGGRDFGDMPRLVHALNAIDNDRKIESVIHGGARGADLMAASWALYKNRSIEVFKPDWKTHGKAAGPIRNQQMLDEGRPDFVVAFPGGRGTRDMISRARHAGIEVLER